MKLSEEIIELLKSAYAAGYSRYGMEMAGWETDSGDAEVPLGFDDWLAEEAGEQ